VFRITLPDRIKWRNDRSISKYQEVDMKLSLKTLFSRNERRHHISKPPAKPLPTHESMYIEHMRRKMDDHPLHQTWERRVDW
jgi:hypothetical protein